MVIKSKLEGEGEWGAVTWTQDTGPVADVSDRAYSLS